MVNSDSSNIGQDHQRGGKRIWPVLLPVVLLLLLILVGVPAYFASRTDFYRGYKDFKNRHRAWRASTHNKMSCINCHTKPGLTGAAVFRISLIGEFYMRYITSPSQPTIFEKPVRETCLQCHTLDRTVTTSIGLRIPHKTHLTSKKVKITNCLDCHGGLVHEEHPAKRNWNQPRMITCLRSKCHDDKQASKECSTCHPSDFELVPDYHREAGFITSVVKNVRSDHVKRYKNNEKYCYMCHERKYCDDCHGTDMPHPNKKKIWVTGQKNHAQTSKAQPGLCKNCHTQSDFCTNCHHDHDPAKGPWLSTKRGESVHPSVVREKGTPSCLEDCHDSTFCADPCHLKP